MEGMCSIFSSSFFFSSKSENRKWLTCSEDEKKTLTTMSALYVGFMVLVVFESAIADKGGSVVGDNVWHVLGVQAKRELLDNAPMKYVCQATAAAPTYLPPVDFILTDPNSTPPVSRAFNLIDGGVAVSNPVSIQILIIKAFQFLFFSRTVQAIQPCMYRHTHDQFFCFDLFTACFFLCVCSWEFWDDDFPL
jgi:hypothetical protein